MPRLITVVALAALLAATALGKTDCERTPAAEPSVCKEKPIDTGYQLGISLQQVLPANLPDYIPRATPAYGVSFGVPLAGGLVQALVQYAAIEQFWLASGELNYRALLPTPFITLYGLAGAHFLRYSNKGVAHAGPGATAGFGILLPMSPIFQVHLGLKGYIRRSTLVTIGGGFNFLL